VKDLALNQDEEMAEEDQEEEVKLEHVSLIEAIT